ncbi:MAG: helix-turn-helix domain-containing protein [Bacilli bacterium]
MNRKYRDFTKLVPPEIRRLKNADLEEIAFELDICVTTLSNILNGNQEPSVFTAFKMLEILGVCGKEGYDFIDKVKEVVKSKRKAKTTAVQNWIRRNSYYRVRWSTYLDFCDRAEVDAFEFWVD